MDDTLDYWVTRMDLWPELAQYVFELLNCPAASVLSECTFREVVGLSVPDTVDWLTFGKINQSCISNNF